MVDGYAVGAGSNLALCCDLIVASERARFGELFCKIGLAVDGGGTWLLPRLVGLARAKELVFTGDIIDAAEGFRIGLVNRVVGAEDLATATRARRPTWPARSRSRRSPRASPWPRPITRRVSPPSSTSGRRDSSASDVARRLPRRASGHYGDEDEATSEAAGGVSAGSRGPRRLVDRVVELGRGPSHLVGDPGGVERRADDPRRDQEQELRLLDLPAREAEQPAEDRDVLEQGDPAVVEGHRVLDEPAQDERHVVQRARPRFRLLA